MKRLSQVFILFLVLIGACIDPLDVNIDKEVKILIVEGAITTKPGPYSISLTQTAKFGSIFDGFIKPVKSARVVIRDSAGEIYTLQEEGSSGIYTTSPSFRPVVGMSYSLLITTLNGTEYTSLPEKVTKAPEIIELTATFEKTPIANNKFKTGLMVSAKFQDEPDVQNFSLWRNSGTYKIATFPENFIARNPPAPPTPAPKDCCSTCWVEENRGDKTIRILSDINSSGNQIVYPAAFIEDDGIRYTDKYLIRIEHHTLTREAFQFFNLLTSQLDISGDIFDPPPATTRGNMINLSDPDDNVIGYFRASDVSIDSIFLTRDMLLEPVVIRQINDDCRVINNGSTTEPEYW